MDLKKFIKWCLLWVFVPYIAIGILSYKYLFKNIDNKALRLTCSFFVSLITIMIFLTICSSEDNKTNEQIKQTQQNIETKVPETTKIPETTRNIEKESIKKTPENKTIKNSSNTKISLENALIIFEECYKNVAEIKYNKLNNSIDIIPLNDYFMYSVLAAKAGDAECLKLWNEIINNLKKTSKLMDDETIYITIVNNLNDDNSLLIINNGKVLYNCLND